MFLVLVIGGIEACTGNCKACHQGLDYQNDIRHIAMFECKQCHTDEKMAAINMGGCGQDCFTCHDAGKLRTSALAAEHQVIDSCMKCHIELNKSPFATGLGVFKKGVESFSEGIFSKTMPNN